MSPRHRPSSVSCTLLTSLLLLAVTGCRPGASTADAIASETAPAQPEWLAALDAPHRMLFDVTDPETSVALAHVLNYYGGWQAEDGSTDEEVDGILTFYGGTTLFGLDDEMWTKYGLGEISEQRNTEGAFATENPWYTAPIIGGNPIAPAGIRSLGERGVTFLLCNNALSFYAGLVARERGLDRDEVYADMVDHILPEVTLVPAMVVAIDQAQQAGISHHRQ
jgi:intracellular sulfur oxidation DsrE/DsrF family protein